MKYILLLLSLFPLTIYSQAIHISEIKYKPSPKYYNTTDSTILYPVIVTGNQSISGSINEVIKEQILEPEDNKLTARQALRNMIKDGLTDLSYEVTYNKNGILSLKFDIQVEAAYPSSSQRYLNFDVRTGHYLEIKDIVNENMFEQLKSKVFEDKIDSLRSYKEKDLKGQLLHKEIDSVTYQWAAGIVDSDCIVSVSLDNFSLSPTGIEIIDECEFPHVIKGIKPTYVLRYSYQFMFPFIKSTFLGRLP